MNIVYDNNIFYHQKSGGGSVVFYELLQRALNDKELNCQFIEYGHTDNPYQDKLMIPRSRVTERRPSSLLYNRFFPVNYKCNEKFIFHSTYFSYCSNPFAVNLTTVHDFTELRKGRGFMSKMRAKLQMRIIRRSSVIVCISENTKKDLLYYLPEIDPSIIHVIYNGVSEVFCENKSQADLPFAPNSYLIFVGCRDGYKNFSLLQEIISQTNYNLVIVGGALCESERLSLEEKIPASRYYCTGFVSEEKLNILYNNAAALVYPSSYEGFGLPVLEAQRAGCPVIALNASSIPEVIACDASNYPLLMRETTGEEMLGKIELLSNQDIVRTVIKDGLENSKRFSWDKAAHEYKLLYNSILK